MNCKKSNFFYLIVFLIFEFITHFAYKVGLVSNLIAPNHTYLFIFRFFELACLFFLGFYLLRTLIEKEFIHVKTFYKMDAISKSVFILFILGIMSFEVIAANIDRGVPLLYFDIIMGNIWLPTTLLLGCACGYFHKPAIEVVA